MVYEPELIISSSLRTFMVWRKQFFFFYFSGEKQTNPRLLLLMLAFLFRQYSLRSNLVWPCCTLKESTTILLGFLLLMSSTPYVSSLIGHQRWTVRGEGGSFLREANLMIILIYYRQSLVSNSLGLEPLLFATVARTASVAVVLKNGWEAE